MSFNPAISAAAPRLNADVFASHTESHQPAGQASARSFDDVSWCGTKVPGLPPLPPHPHTLASVLGSRLEQVALNPQPLPPKELAGAAQQLGRAALDCDGCGTVPHKLPHFPPPPPPWAGAIGEIANRR